LKSRANLGTSLHAEVSDDRRDLTRSGVAASALRFYEEKGLITSERAGPGTAAIRARSCADRVHRLRAADRPDARGDRPELAKLPPHRAPTRRDWARLSQTWTSRIDERIAELQRLRAGLTECIGCGCLSLERCQLSNPGDRAARNGPGPRYWVGDRPG
jgi:MerR family redox-sensitive transcriptional activator SoxR